MKARGLEAMVQVAWTVTEDQDDLVGIGAVGDVATTNSCLEMP